MLFDDVRIVSNVGSSRWSRDLVAVPASEVEDFP